MANMFTYIFQIFLPQPYKFRKINVQYVINFGVLFLCDLIHIKLRLFGFDICMTLLKIAKISEPDCIRKLDDYDIQL